ncbi:protein EXECUTER 1, chloroplastic [Dioscorea cayenensis subsp. rotundata]|uniref:Protein EXECUTER 1, chloroplastic n=1 Tax=Dioscorea cayennensis subsp. rotundata TaxID=55577 RepID=A0AB40CHB8_DIOCR|nr:protein EXECUTER 1, chloroplastic [Dioscorea cayenensis subsp. rotundata]
MASVPAPSFSSPTSSYVDPSISTTNLAPRLLAATPCRATSPFPRFSARTYRPSDSPLCRCSRGEIPEEPVRRGWDSLIKDVVKSAVKRWEDYVNSSKSSASKDRMDVESEETAGKGEEEEVEWDWERWEKHFAEVEEQENLVAALKSQLRVAVAREDYEEAAKLKAAIMATTKKDTVATAISELKRAVVEERYGDAAFFRDYAGCGLVGWWSGTSTNAAEPSGRIIHISAEHGRYVARSYTSRQLSTARPGSPLFEVFFTVNGGEYKQQAVYLKRNDRTEDLLLKTSNKQKISNPNPSDSSTEEQGDIYVEDITAVEEKDDDADMVDGINGIQNVLRDMIPGVKVKVLKVVSPGKVDRDLIAKVIEQIMEEEGEDNEELESIDADKAKSESDNEEVIDSEDALIGTDDLQPGLPVKLVIGTIMRKFSADLSPIDLIRVPAALERKDRRSFSFSIQQNDTQLGTSGKEESLRGKASLKSDKRSSDLIMSDLAKVLLSKEKIPMKVLKDVGELISSAIKQDQNQPFSGSMLFNRIEISSSADPLSGLYVGAHGIYASEILHLKRKFGQWQENDRNTDLEFYEYVEAVKLTGSLSLPAGQIVFRAKVGKRYQLPHKGIIPEEFGVVARYKGQGRIADPGFQNARWVDGELVILDGKFIKGGVVVGFVYWAPEYHFLVFFNRLKLPET